MSYILYQISKTILHIFKKKHNEKIDNTSIKIYVNKIENKIKIKIKTGYYSEILTPETVKLLGTNKNEITRDKNGGNVPHFEVVLIHCKIVNNDYQQDNQ